MKDKTTGKSASGGNGRGDDPAAPPGQPGQPGDPLAQSGRIGAQLRALYDELEREPIPADLIELLEKLDEAEQRQRR
jgi:hypothetical protein